ncbi:MAG: flagellar export chaperone FliS [Kiritimatiellae bacterium]|nr:flagellar export chaperone FliS [Kiritimatiellia bacterium]
MPGTEDYRRTHVMTASPMELILMLYDEAIRSLTTAEKALAVTGDDPGRFEAINNALLHAQDVITELSVSLDMERGGEIAVNLQRLYDFMVHHLAEANAKKALQPVKDVREMLNDLREAWEQVTKKELPRTETAAPPQRKDNVLFSG